jgi:tetratricopeptide (TPR) repeat protein
MKQGNLTHIFAFLLGLFSAICVSILIISFTLLYHINSTYSQNQLNPNTNDITQTPDSDTAAILAEARKAITQGNPEEVKELILPYVDDWPSVSDRADGYFLVGDAERQMGRPQMAIPYFKKANELQPTPERLFELAITYDMAGDNKNALVTYRQLLIFEDTDSTVDYNIVRQRILEISTALGTKTPQIEPTP